MKTISFAVVVACLVGNTLAAPADVAPRLVGRDLSALQDLSNYNADLPLSAKEANELLNRLAVTMKTDSQMAQTGKKGGMKKEGKMTKTLNKRKGGNPLEDITDTAGSLASSLPIIGGGSGSSSGSSEDSGGSGFDPLSILDDIFSGMTGGSKNAELPSEKRDAMASKSSSAAASKSSSSGAAKSSSGSSSKSSSSAKGSS